MTKVKLRLPFVGRSKWPVGARKKVCSWGKKKKVLDAELWAISEVLGIASKTANVGSTPITIFGDSQKALKAIALPFTRQENRFLRSLIY